MLWTHLLIGEINLIINKLITAQILRQGSCLFNKEGHEDLGKEHFLQQERDELKGSHQQKFFSLAFIHKVWRGLSGKRRGWLHITSQFVLPGFPSQWSTEKIFPGQGQCLLTGVAGWGCPTECLMASNPGFPLQKAVWGRSVNTSLWVCFLLDELKIPETTWAHHIPMYVNM